MKTKALPIRAIIIPLAAIYAATLLCSALGLLREAEASAEELGTEISELKKENERLGYYIDHADDDGVIAELAEERLGLMDKDVVIFYDSACTAFSLKP